MRGVQCFVCGLKLDAVLDLDPALNRIQMDISFGVNMHSGILSEVGISKYAVFLADEAGFRFEGWPMVINVTAENKANGTTCCDINAYKNVRIKAELPENVTQVRLEVVPVYEDDGWSDAMPAGLMTGLVKDWYDPAFVRLSHACRRSHPLRLVALLVAVVAYFFVGAQSRSTPETGKRPP